MRQLPALDMSSNVTKFWRSYVYIGVLTYSLGASAVLVYSLTTPGPHRQAMVDPERAQPDRLRRGFPAPRSSPRRDAMVQAVLHLLGRLHVRVHRRRRRPRRWRAESHLVFPDSADALRRPGLLRRNGLVPGRLRRPHDPGGRRPDPRSQLVHDGVPRGRDGHRRRHHGRGGGAAGPPHASADGCSQSGRPHGMPQPWRLPGAPGPRIAPGRAPVRHVQRHCGRPRRPQDAQRRQRSPLRGPRPEAPRQRPAAGGPRDRRRGHGSEATSSRCCCTRPIRRRPWPRRPGCAPRCTTSTGSDWVTASIGVSTWQGPNDTADALLRRADEALYVAKRSGRNCAVPWEPPVADPSSSLQWLRDRSRHITSLLASPAEAVG